MWTQKATFPEEARAVAVGFSIGNFGYIGTGATNSGSAYDLWQYDPVSDTWVQKASIPIAIGIQEAGCFVIGTDAYIIGGLYVSTVWEYHSVTRYMDGESCFPRYCQDRCPRILQYAIKDILEWGKAAVILIDIGNMTPYRYMDSESQFRRRWPR